ncbi:MAG: 30S ribosomal protein S6 [Anaerolineae bacterium]|nr:30S ribosomal protein S6 [Anaerolineae bacterium]
MKRAYEVIFIVRVDIDDATLNGTVDQVRSWIEADELGQVMKIDRWGRRKLAYEIEKLREGYYVLMESQLEPHAIKELERNINLSQNILRYLVVRTEE